MLSAKHGRILRVKIVVKAEKAGQPLAQFEYQVETEDKPHKSAGKAVAKFCKRHPGVHLFDEDVRLKFERVE
jgi:hypothetical protein